MKIYPLGLCSLLGLTVSLVAPVMARNIEMHTYPGLTRQSVEPNCPQKLLVNESNRPYREGGYTIDGTASLTDIATNIQFADSDFFSVTWKGTLKPTFQNCLGTAKISTVQGEQVEAYSYLRVRYEQGQVFFTLDMTGNRDVNGYTTSILRQNIVNGNPSWSWGGTD